MKYLAGIILGLLLVVGRADAEITPLFNVAFQKQSFSSVDKIVVLRRDPLAESIMRVSAKNIQKLFTDEAIITSADYMNFRLIREALDSRTIGNCDRKEIDVSWAVIFEDSNGNTVAAVYLDQHARCAEIFGKTYLVEPDLGQVLKRLLSFMNY